MRSAVPISIRTKCFLVGGKDPKSGKIVVLKAE
jgi:hypothetical protein